MKKISINSDNTNQIVILIATVICALIAFWQLGLGIYFWAILIIWALLYFFHDLIKIQIALWITIGLTIIFSFLVSFHVIFPESSNGNINNSGSTKKSADGISLSPCTSNASDTPAMVDGMKTTIYSAKLLSNSPNPDAANNIRSFSYSGIKNKSETNSLYARIERTDSNAYITGYGTAMEACDNDNMASWSYTTANTDYVASDRVSASVHYIHGGNYIHGTGSYRIDVYIKTLDGKWHLADRLNSIEITK